MSDTRTREDRDELTYQRITQQGGFSLSWLHSNRDIAASVHRLTACGRIAMADVWISVPGEGELEPYPTSWWGRVFRWMVP